MKRFLVRIKNVISVYFGTASLFRFINRRRAIILTYHLLLPQDRASTRAICSISESEFLRHIKWLSKNYTIVRLSKIVDCISKKKEFPKKCLAVTFDDGYENFIKVAYPILKKYNIPTTLFLSAGMIGTSKMFWYDLIEYLVLNTEKNNLQINIEGKIFHFIFEKKRKNIEDIVTILKKMSNKKKDDWIHKMKNLLLTEEGPHAGIDYIPMNWEQVEKICLDTLITIGSHTNNHVILSRLSKEEMREEIENSKNKIEKHTQRLVEHFSYPNGQPEDFNDYSKRKLKEAGYRSSCTTIEDFNDRTTDLYELRRFGASLPLSELIVKISGFDNTFKLFCKYIGIYNK